MRKVLQNDYETFVKSAKKICPDRVYTDFLRRYAYGVDASCYSYVPKVVVKVNTETEVVLLIKLANACETPLTFRGAGSSLSGQGLTEHILIVANDGFKHTEVLDNGRHYVAHVASLDQMLMKFLSLMVRKLVLILPRLQPLLLEVLSIIILAVCVVERQKIPIKLFAHCVLFL